MADAIHDHDPEHHEHEEQSELWRNLLLGTDPYLQKLRRFWMKVPAPPRCKLCAAPTAGLGGLVARAVHRGGSATNPLMCDMCVGSLRAHPGGAELEISVLFADVRGSTGIAEKTGAARFRRLLQRFYAVASRAIDAHGGLVDKFLGDGIMALFLPVIAGHMHAAAAIAAGRDLLIAADDPQLASAGVRIGAGVHSGVAFVGVLGSGDKLDFSALGDTVNVAARLGSLAGPGELVTSASSWEAAALGAGEGERRRVDIAGRSEPLDVVRLAVSKVAA